MGRRKVKKKDRGKEKKEKENDTESCVAPDIWNLVSHQ